MFYCTKYTNGVEFVKSNQGGELARHIQKGSGTGQFLRFPWESGNAVWNIGILCRMNIVTDSRVSYVSSHLFAADENTGHVYFPQITFFF